MKYLISFLAIWSLANPAWAQVKICALLPHIKDSYWLSVNQGLVEQARQAGVQLWVQDAGGYPNQQQQQQQFLQCQQWQADVVLLGSVSLRLPPAMAELVAQTPTISLVNQIEQAPLVGQVGASWLRMGQQIGDYINQHYAQHSTPITTLLMLGPATNGGSRALQRGIEQQVSAQRLDIQAVLNGSNSVEVQRRLLRQYLADNPPPQLIIGGAVAIEVAIAELRRLGIAEQVDLIASYLSHGVYRGLLRGKVLMTNDDQMRQQGQWAITQALRYLAQGQVLQPLVPTPKLISRDQSLATWSDSLSDPDFRASYRVGGD
ncbi:TMAO reductase system periplasmic protein TorT [Ferrimonas senticii]|uniref:TMAO reductase system periplasmic protein TorT n=1 Tax=Ferrimonas senticii TaxID=394566 RepID=UPI0004278CC4|nr:TMAO reductase system periplasmic protein TorT [Ferrimonas senticii]